MTTASLVTAESTYRSEQRIVYVERRFWVTSPDRQKQYIRNGNSGYGQKRMILVRLFTRTRIIIVNAKANHNPKSYLNLNPKRCG